MTPRQLLSGLRAHDVVLRVEGGRLVVDGPDEVLTPALEARLRRYKVQLIELLTTEATLAAASAWENVPDPVAVAREHPFVRAVLETLGGTIVAARLPKSASVQKADDGSDNPTVDPGPVNSDSSRSSDG